MGICWYLNIVFYIGKPTTHIEGFCFLFTNLSNQCEFLQGNQHMLGKLVHWAMDIKIFYYYHCAPLKSKPGLYKKINYFLTDLADLQLYS